MIIFIILMMIIIIQLVPLEIVNKYNKKMLNSHPALLPAYGGKGMYGSKIHK